LRSAEKAENVDVKTRTVVEGCPGYLQGTIRRAARNSCAGLAWRFGEGLRYLAKPEFLYLARQGQARVPAANVLGAEGGAMGALTSELPQE